MLEKFEAYFFLILFEYLFVIFYFIFTGKQNNFYALQPINSNYSKCISVLLFYLAQNKIGVHYIALVRFGYMAYVAFMVLLLGSMKLFTYYIL